MTEVAGELCFNADDVLLVTNQVFLHIELSPVMLLSISINVLSRPIINTAMLLSYLMHY